MERDEPIATRFCASRNVPNPPSENAGQRGKIARVPPKSRREFGAISMPFCKKEKERGWTTRRVGFAGAKNLLALHEIRVACMYWPGGYGGSLRPLNRSRHSNRQIPGVSARLSSHNSLVGPLSREPVGEAYRTGVSLLHTCSRSTQFRSKLGIRAREGTHARLFKRAACLSRGVRGKLISCSSERFSPAHLIGISSRKESRRCNTVRRGVPVATQTACTTLCDHMSCNRVPHRTHVCNQGQMAIAWGGA